MKLERLPHEPAALVDFYQESLETLGALCERTWFDKIQVVAEGPAARLWGPEDSLREIELHFPKPDAAGPRDAQHEVFPGCPLTFRLTETLRPQPLPLERILISGDAQPPPPVTAVAEKLWHAQHPGTTRWQLQTPFVTAHHFSLLALVRVEIQSIDQHWSLHRLAISLPDGAIDDDLAASFAFSQAARPDSTITWPTLSNARLRELLAASLQQEMAGELKAIRARQEKHLRRELQRVQDYFEGYELELKERVRRSHNENTKLKADERLAAARAEHDRRRTDQVQRHEIRVMPHWDALLLLAEPAWSTTITTTSRGTTHTQPALFIPRSRRWIQHPASCP